MISFSCNLPSFSNIVTCDFFLSCRLHPPLLSCHLYSSFTCFTRCLYSPFACLVTIFLCPLFNHWCFPYFVIYRPPLLSCYLYSSFTCFTCCLYSLPLSCYDLPFPILVTCNHPLAILEPVISYSLILSLMIPFWSPSLLSHVSHLTCDLDFITLISLSLSWWIESLSWLISSAAQAYHFASLSRLSLVCRDSDPGKHALVW